MIDRREFLLAASGAALVACAPQSHAILPTKSSTTGSPMELSPLGTMTITMGKTLFMASAPVGSRLIIDFVDVAIQGARLNAKKAAALPAGDWLSVGPNNVATLDIRFVLETNDGATIYVHGTGRTDSATFSKGAPCYFAPLFETNDERYAWLNKVQAVAKGTAKDNVVTFELAELT
ncbi:MAG: DUF3237 domain-containing protein [Polyangiaceae bacterium]